MTKCIVTIVAYRGDEREEPLRKDVCFDFVPPIPRVGEGVRTDFDNEARDFRVREISYLLLDGTPPNVFITLDLDRKTGPV